MSEERCSVAILRNLAVFVGSCHCPGEWISLNFSGNDAVVAGEPRRSRATAGSHTTLLPRTS
jgi:hypothetical protein